MANSHTHIHREKCAVLCTYMHSETQRYIEKHVDRYAPKFTLTSLNTHVYMHTHAGAHRCPHRCADSTYSYQSTHPGRRAPLLKHRDQHTDPHNTQLHLCS